MSNENINLLIKDRIISIISKDTNNLSANSLYNSIMDSSSVTVEISLSSFLRTISYNNNTVNFYVVLAICQYYGITVDSLINSNEITCLKEQDSISNDICGTYTLFAYLTEKGNMNSTLSEITIEIKNGKYFAELKNKDGEKPSIHLCGYGRKNYFLYFFDLLSVDSNGKNLMLLINSSYLVKKGKKHFSGLFYFYNEDYQFNDEFIGKFYATDYDLISLEAKKFSMLLNLNNESIDVRMEDVAKLRRSDKQFNAFMEIVLNDYSRLNEHSKLDKPSDNVFTYSISHLYSLFFEYTFCFRHLKTVFYAGNPPEFKKNDDMLYHYAVVETIDCVIKLLSISRLNKRVAFDDDFFKTEQLIYNYTEANEEIQKYINKKPVKKNIIFTSDEESYNELFKNPENE